MSDAPPPTPQSTPQTTFTVYAGPPLETIRQIVASQFQIKDGFLDPYGVPTMVVAVEPAKEKFKAILQQLNSHRLIAAIRESGDTLTIKVFQKPHLRPSRRIINLILFIATVATVSIAGYFLWTGGLGGSQSLQAGYNAIIYPLGANPYLKAASFAIGLLAIIGLHEFGHKATAVHHKMDATLPYFIPGPPPIGTFGALISLRGPPANRDQLFDLGLSGPVVGFIVTIIVATLSMLLGPNLSQTQISSLNTWNTTCSAQYGQSCLTSIDWSAWPSQPALLILISFLGGIVNPGSAIDQQLFFAAEIGALLTFLNIVPAWQLDGGHISRAVFGPSGHRVASMIGIILLLVVGYIPFAILVLVMMGLSGRGFAGVEPLDDVSPVSNSRKILYLLGIAMLVLTFGRTFASF